MFVEGEEDDGDPQVLGAVTDLLVHGGERGHDLELPGHDAGLGEEGVDGVVDLDDVVAAVVVVVVVAELVVLELVVH